MRAGRVSLTSTLLVCLDLATEKTDGGPFAFRGPRRQSPLV
jgi:hypothetical protein